MRRLAVLLLTTLTATGCAQKCGVAVASEDGNAVFSWTCPDIDAIEVIDLASGEPLTQGALRGLRADPSLMPLSRDADGYFARFREDGSLVPWDLDRGRRTQRRQGQEASSTGSS